ncbi:MAG: PHP domain-containing protein [Bacillota bacterium]
MRFTGDYHMHTRYSDGRATMREMVEAARAKGLEEVAITDHGPHTIRIGVRQANTYLAIKSEAKLLNKELDNIKILVGAEASVTGVNGEIDVPPDIYQRLDRLLVGLHPYVWPHLSGIGMLVGNPLRRLSKGLYQKAMNTNTKALVEVMNQHPVDVITHPGLDMPVDIGEVARACAKTDTFFEFNTGHFYQTPEEIRVAAKEGVKFILNSDAHFPETVGQLEQGLAVLEQAGVPVEQIVNVVN